MIIPLLLLCLQMSSNPDTLEKQLDGSQGLARAKILLKLTQHYANKDPERAVGYGEESLEIASKAYHSELQGKLYQHLCAIFTSWGAYETAQDYADKGLAISKIEKDNSLLSWAHNNIGVIHLQQGRYGEALTWFLSSLDLRVNIDDQKGIAESLNNIGNVYMRQVDYQKALDYYQQSLSIRRSLNDREGVAGTLNNLGVVFRNKGEYKTALSRYEEALVINRELKNLSGVAVSLSTIGNIYRYQRRFNEAETHLQESLELATQLGNKKRMSICFSQLGNLRREQKRLDDALDYHQKALDIRRQLGNRHSTGDSLTQMAMIYALKGDHQMQSRYLMWALDEKSSLETELTRLRHEVSLAEKEREVSMLIQRQAKVKEMTDAQKQTIDQLNADAIISRRNQQMTNTLLMASGALLLLMALVMNRRANRRQLQVERQTKNRLEDLVSVRTAELVSRCDELETFEEIIQTINRERELSRVLITMLDQALVLFPKADRGAFLLWAPERDRFEVVATSGYAEDALANIYFSHEEMLARYSTGDTLRPGVVLIDDFETLPGKDKLEGLEVPSSLVATEVRLGDQIQGFFVLETYARNSFFEHDDTHRLIRFREHMVSALEKAHHLGELQRINQEILETQDKLITQQKMASLGVLSAGIAHEMKNPLNFVNTLTELNQELGRDLRESLEAYQKDPNEEHQNNLLDVLEDFEQNSQLINKHGKRANQIVSVMMEMAQGGSVEKRLFRLNALVDEFVMLAYKGMATKDRLARVRLELDLSEEVGSFMMAPQNLSRVIINMVNNAFESVVKKKNEANDDYVPRIRVTTKSLGDEVVLRIYDNGKGISEEDRNHIWEHFYSTKPSNEGNIGLGLAISYDIVVNEHHGTIQVESDFGEYAEFILTFPGHIPATAADSVEPSSV